MDAPTSPQHGPHGGLYARRNPSETFLYQLVGQHYASFVQRNAERGGVLPWFVRREFESFLTCGILAYGFIRLHCHGCGMDRLVAFSCKGRSLCPSCGVRRMLDGAAQLVDRVLPHAPARQWVLSLPHAVRFAIAFDAALCSRVLALFIAAVRRVYRHAAKAYVGLASVQQAQTGSVTCIQRFSSALGLNVHFHALFVDGVFLESAPDTVAFRALPPPTKAQLQAVTDEVCARVRKLLGDDDDTKQASARRLQDAEPLLAACAGASVIGRIATGERAGSAVQRLGTPNQTAAGRPRPGPDGADTEGFNLHAGVRVPAHDRARLERVCRYILRPPISQQRLQPLPDGRIAYQLKRPWSDGTLAVAFSPQELLEKLAALVPPPRAHQVVYHGVFAPHARLRPAVVPAQPVRSTPEHPDDPPRHPGCGRQMDWAALLKRVHAVDALNCPRCSSRMRIIAAITQTQVIRAILRACGLPTTPPERRSAAPAGRQLELDWPAA